MLTRRGAGGWRGSDLRLPACAGWMMLPSQTIPIFRSHPESSFRVESRSERRLWGLACISVPLGLSMTTDLHRRSRRGRLGDDQGLIAPGAARMSTRRKHPARRRPRRQPAAQLSAGPRGHRTVAAAVATADPSCMALSNEWNNPGNCCVPVLPGSLAPASRRAPVAIPHAADDPVHRVSVGGTSSCAYIGATMHPWSRLSGVWPHAPPTRMGETSPSPCGVEVAGRHQCFDGFQRLSPGSGQTAFDYRSIGRGFISLRAHQRSWAWSKSKSHPCRPSGPSIFTGFASVDDFDPLTLEEQVIG